MRIDDLVHDQEFWEPIVEAHSDAKRLVRSGKVGEWVEKQGSDGLKRLYKSPNPEHGILVLDAYKEAMAKVVRMPAQDGADDKAKTAADALHGNTLKGKRDVKTLGPKPGEDGGNPADFDAGFDEGTKA